MLHPSIPRIGWCVAIDTDRDSSRFANYFAVEEGDFCCRRNDAAVTFDGRVVVRDRRTIVAANAIILVGCRLVGRCRGLVILLCHSVVAKVAGDGAPFILDGVADTVGVIVRAAS